MWRELRDRCRSIEPGTVVVTPESEDPFTVGSVGSDRIVVEFLESDGERVLGRDQFEALYDRLESDLDGMSLTDLPAGVEPYVSIVSLSSRYVVEDSSNEIRFLGQDESPGATNGEDGDGRTDSPYLRPDWTVRKPPERLHDDAILLVDALGRHDLEDVGSIPPETLADVYVLLSDVQRGSNDLRKEVGDHLLEHVGPDGRLHGQFGTVQRTTRNRRRLREVDVIFEALDDRNIPREWVMGIAREKLDVVLAVTDLEEDAVYDVEIRCIPRRLPSRRPKSSPDSRVSGTNSPTSTLKKPTSCGADRGPRRANRDRSRNGVVHAGSCWSREPSEVITDGRRP